MEEVSLKNASFLGKIGVILMIVGFVVSGVSVLLKIPSYVSSIIYLLSQIAFLFSLKEISEKTHTKEIFTNYLVAFVIYLITSIGSIFIFPNSQNLNITYGASVSLSTSQYIILIASFILAVVAIYFMKQSFEFTGYAIQNDNFKKAGRYLFTTVILFAVFALVFIVSMLLLKGNSNLSNIFFLILLLIGISVAIVAIIAAVYELIAFFTIPEKIEVVKEEQ